MSKFDNENRKIVWISKDRRDKLNEISAFYRKYNREILEELIDAEYEKYIEDLKLKVLGN